MSETDEAKVDGYVPTKAHMMFLTLREPETGWEYPDDISYRGVKYEIVAGGPIGCSRIPAVGEEVSLRRHRGSSGTEPADKFCKLYEVVGIRNDYTEAESPEEGERLDYTVSVFMRPTGYTEQE